MVIRQETSSVPRVISLRPAPPDAAGAAVVAGLFASVRRVPDALFANARLAQIYDALDPDRSDLDAYLAMVDEFGARWLLDVGCGTGTFACLAAARGTDVVGVDPAEASLDVARTKPGSDLVRWIHGDATGLPSDVSADLVTMTANVAQVFVEDDAWAATLAGVKAAMSPRGRFVFETRDPTRRAWESWTRERSRRTTDIAGVGQVESWVEVTDVSLPLISFRWTYRFAADGAELVSDSTLRFRDSAELDESLIQAGLEVLDVRDAPDRPGLEFVYVAGASDS